MTRALVVDDRPENLYLLRTLLQGHGHEVIEARHGAEALLKARADPPQIVISDLLMPVMDGFTLLRHWRSDARLQAIPFVVYTATYTDPKDERLALDLGADAFILKPAEPAAFMARIGEVLAKQECGERVAPHAPPADDEGSLAEYSEVLVRKLEERSFQLEQANSDLREDIARRERAEADVAALLAEAERARAALLGILEDERAAQVALQESETRYRAFFEQSMDAILLTSTDGRIHQANAAACAMFGRSERELRSLERGALVDMNDPHLRPLLELRARTGRAIGELTMLRADGGAFPVELSSAVFRDREGSERTSMIIRDISARRRADEALRASERRFRLAAATGDVWEADIATGGGFIPAHFKRMLGYDDGEIDNTLEAFAALVHPDDRGRWRQALQDHVRRRLPYALDLRVRSKSGDYRWFATRGQAAWDDNGRATYMAGTSFDITDRKRAEAERLLALERFEKVFLGAPEAMSISELETGRFLHVNDAFCEMFGYARAALIGHTSLELSLWSSALRRDFVVGKVRAGERVLAMEGQARTRSGELRDTLFSAERIDFGGTSCLLLMFSDISQRKRAEAALRDSEERLRFIIEGTGTGLWDWELATNRVTYSREWKRLLGYEEHEVADHLDEWRRLTHPDDVDRALAEVGAYLQRPAGTLELEFRMRHKNGEYRWIQSRAAAQLGGDGEPVRLRGLHIDITERRIVEEAVRESEIRLRNVLDNMFPFVGLLSLDGRVLEVNRAPLEAAGLTRGEVIGQPCAEILWFGYSSEVRDRLRAALVRAGAGESVRYDETIRVSGGRFLVIDLMFSPLRDAAGRVLQIVGSATDITERKRAEDELRQASQRLQTLSARLLAVQEEERAAIARELHDEIGQSLTALKLGAQALGRGIDADRAKKLAECVAIVDHTLAQTRNLALDLRPPQLDHLGLAAALRDYSERVAANAGLECVFSADRDYRALDRQLATAAFRVAQEALTNVARHAGARKIAVELRMQGDELLLAVSDDGCGYDLAEARRRALKGGSMGILGMEERIGLAGGQLKIVTRPGQGTRVQATFPLAPLSAGGPAA